MLGYIRIFEPELKVYDWRIYRKAYCSLCNAIGGNYGEVSRYCLSYDATFFLILFFAMSNKEIPLINYKRSPCFSFKKRKHLNDDIYRIFSGISVIIAQYRICDNIYDSKSFINKSLYRFARIILFRSYKKAKKALPQIDNITQQFITDQKAVEKNGNVDDITVLSEPTSIEMHGLCKEALRILKIEEDEDILKQFCFYLGRWTYLIDTIDDFKKDKISGKFNAILACNNKENIIEYLQDLLDECIVKIVRRIMRCIFTGTMKFWKMS